LDLGHVHAIGVSLCGYCLEAACASGGSPAGIHGLFSGRDLGTIETSYKSLLGNRVSRLYWIGLVVHASLYDSSFIVLQCFLYYHSEYHDDKKDVRKSG
ncbi:hypothetical protein Tco_1115948, partial [Tanacetum coccineum]